MTRRPRDASPYTMETMESSLVGAFRSENLIYRAIEDDESDKHFIFRSFWSDPVNYGFALLGILRPQSRQNGYKEIEEMIRTACLAVMVCLPYEKDETSSQASMQMDTPTELVFDTRRKSIPIGILIVERTGPDVMRRARIGIQIAAPYQNRGYGRESINWALDWSFRFADLHRVEIGTGAYNERATALYKKMGFRLEGVMKEALFMDRKWHDLLSFGMLAREWESLRSAKLALDDLQRGFSFKQTDENQNRKAR
ncbi:hypothetical protein JX265_013824 [Neoarthrinium moseri]|uniref:N-acetyltransferase domain-containing protein n=1 Tax=Neoarthrinium moseri TaxID=1658444 RepID=A0A9Q0AHB4_9PEZI|nr:uncharacterized protein JN550_013911 [Neoarthrinium moseri]KAI1840428.1 hypothetical protein JX266_013355 [Neoarthrinium moseri]KAI1848298.1 hypothetical protein JX265_013824 [Neoarthrinium moseri]KAI1856079.1 hypothetical protein JN550_013911 [Neoarthrinium moseri]